MRDHDSLTGSRSRDTTDQGALVRKPPSNGDRSKPRRNNDGPTPAAPRQERRPKRVARPHLNLRGTLGDAARAPLEPLLAPKDVARFFNCSPSTVRRMIEDGSLRPLRIAGKPALRFTRAQVEALVSTDAPVRRKPGGGGSGTPSGSSTPPSTP
jgi:excisionase family DNA binding protein